MIGYPSQVNGRDSAWVRLADTAWTSLHKFLTLKLQVNFISELQMDFNQTCPATSWVRNCLSAGESVGIWQPNLGGEIIPLAHF